MDVPAVYHQLNDTYHSSESEEIDVTDRPSTSKVRSKRKCSLLQEISKDWKLACRQLLETLWQCEDSIPFRYVKKKFKFSKHSFLYLKEYVTDTDCFLGNR